MFCQDALYGPTEALNKVRNLSDKLNAKVVAQVNETQELVMINNFMKESNEYLLKKCLQERISDVASWRWILNDLEKRIDESIEALDHEYKALNVVVQRIDDEIRAANACTRPGALCPMVDLVEVAIMQELVFLQEEKKKFQSIIPQIERQRIELEKIKKRIENDTIKKCQAMSVDEACCENNSVVNFEKGIRKKKRCLSLTRWEKRCSTLKDTGINALRQAIMTRQKTREARVQLSIAAQAYGSRVDAVLRRRLHTNVIKLQDLDWQREEAIRDLKSLDNEQIATEKSVLDTMERQRIVESRLADRTLRPHKEHTADLVSYQLRMELGKLRKFTNNLRNNLDRITSLQNSLCDAITQIDCCAEDIMKVVQLDRQRLQARTGDEVAGNITRNNSQQSPIHESPHIVDLPLEVIKEEDENFL
ncbi:tektin-B1-like [Battus philenor]|uniref:tektin-B1-like n=1 Tax=Battus philenor TaxID=42288 RepID=UPI0035D0DA9F